jgi:beta-glucosidase
VHAPGKKDFNLAVAASHHTALAHAAATRAIKAVCPDATVGLTVNMNNIHNESPHDQDVVDFAALNDSNLNRWWIDYRKLDWGFGCWYCIILAFKK